MMIRRRKHQVPGLNTTSTADISFMLLIFFLVTTSMDIDKGVRRELPPADQNKEQQALTNVEKENLMTLVLTADGQLLCNNHPLPLQRVRYRVADFVLQRGRRHLIALSADRHTSYDVYFRLQNELMLAYRQVYSSLAQQHYHRSFTELTVAQKEALTKAYPQRIAESYAHAEGANGVGETISGAKGGHP